MGVLERRSVIIKKEGGTVMIEMNSKDMRQKGGETERKDRDTWKIGKTKGRKGTTDKIVGMKMEKDKERR